MSFIRYLLLLILSLGSATSGWMGTPTSNCKKGTIILLTHQICAQRVTEAFDFASAQRKCMGMGGKILNVPNPQVLQDVRAAFSATSNDDGLKAAWIGIESSADQGSLVLPDGTDVSTTYPAPEPWLFDGSPTQELDDAVKQCQATTGFTYPCQKAIAAVHCYVDPIRNLSPTPEADYMLMQQYMRLMVHLAGADWQGDPTCYDTYNPMFDLDKIDTSTWPGLNLLAGPTNNTSGVYLVKGEKKLPVICEFPIK